MKLSYICCGKKFPLNFSEENEMRNKTSYVNLIRDALRRGKTLPQTSLVYFQGEYNTCFCFWEMYIDPKNNEIRLAYKYSNLIEKQSAKVAFTFPLSLPEKELLKDILFYTMPGGWHYLLTDIEKA